MISCDEWNSEKKGGRRCLKENVCESFLGMFALSRVPLERAVNIKQSFTMLYLLYYVFA